jgi:hypothetical protein
MTPLAEKRPQLAGRVALPSPTNPFGLGPLSPAVRARSFELNAPSPSPARGRAVRGNRTRLWVPLFAQRWIPLAGLGQAIHAFLPVGEVDG